MATQTEYNENMDAGRAGHFASTTGKSFFSRTVEDATAVGYGVAVEQGANDKGCKLAAGGAVIGVTARERSGTVDGYEQNQSARIADEGDIYVVAKVAVNAGDSVHWNAGWVKTGGVQFNGARYETSGAIGALVVITMQKRGA